MEIFIIILVIILTIAVLVNNIINKIKRSRLSQIIDMALEADVQYDITPKSLSGGDSLYHPKVLDCYPDFDLEKAKAEVEKTISIIFNDIEALHGNARVSADKIISHYKGKITALKFHNTAISSFIKSSKSATVKFQTAFEIKIGDKLKQERFETEYTSFLEGEEDAITTYTCDNCGAPLASLDVKACEYCGSGVSFVQEHVWVINSIIIK